MKKKDIKKIKLDKIETEEQLEVKHFIIILLVLIAIIVGIYFLTRIFVTKDLLSNKEEEPIAGSIDYNYTLIGSMLNRVEDEYYVMAFKSSDKESLYYSGLITIYNKNEKPLKVYTADLDDELNKKYYDKDNINAKDFKNLKLGDITLFKIAKGKITESYTKVEDIEKVLAYKKSEK